MKQKAIQVSTRKRFLKIEKLFSETMVGFEVDPIHDFRTELKKVRAFLRLVNIELKEDNALKVPKKLKSFYGNVGIIRNLQLQLKAVAAYGEKTQYTSLALYIEYLENMIEKWKWHAAGLKISESDFYDDEKKILEELPRKIRSSSVKKFLQNKINELELLLKELPGDDILHSIRKLLKDILYNWAFVMSHAKILPSLFSEQQKIKLSTELLGFFLDKAISINLLETYCKDCEENGLFFENEIKVLQEIENEWKTQKQELAQVIYLKFGLLHLLTAV